MNVPASGNDIVSAHNSGNPAQLYKKDFWSEENLKFSEPWYRIREISAADRQAGRGQGVLPARHRLRACRADAHAPAETCTIMAST